MSSLKQPKRSLDDADLVEAQPRPSKRSLSFPGGIAISQHHDRQTSEGGLVDASVELRLDMSSIEKLPQELLLQVFGHLVHPSLITAGLPDKRVKHHSDQSQGEEDLDSDGFGSVIDRTDLRNVCLVSRTFKTVATNLLYRCAHLAKAKSPENLVLTLTAHPDLQPLVKHISIPANVGYSIIAFHGWLKCTNLEAAMGTKFRSVLKRIMPLLPDLRTLIIPQFSFEDGPVIDDLVLPNLTMLRINLLTPPEDTFDNSNIESSVRTLMGLLPDVLGHSFPALQRLEICTGDGTWEADLVSGAGETDECGCPMKYVESLKTTATSKFASAEWHLLTLEQPIFDPSYLHTLVFAGPGSLCYMFGDLAIMEDRDLNRYLSEKGSGLCTLSLDWEVHHLQEDDIQLRYFGPSRCLTELPQLTNLTHLTVSLKALFGHANLFWDWVDDMGDSPDDELAKLLPPSLRTLRIAEYIPGVYEDKSGIPVEEEEGFSNIRYHTNCVCRFLKALRVSWLLRDDGRELWFRRYAALDVLQVESGASLGRSEPASILEGMEERGEGFKRVLRPPEDVA